MIRALTMPNILGDTTIAWTEEQDAEMETIIARKMKEGVTFFIIEPRLGGFLPPRKRELKTAKDAHKHRALSIPDEDLATFVGAGKGEAVKTPDAPVRKSRKSTDAKEVARSQSVGVRPLAGG